MKALIISDDETIVTPIDNYLRNNQFDTIIYKWMIKAIDNIEEIKPNLIVISASEYPRHWKTLVQFVKSGIGGENVKIFLYEPEQISEDDKKKSEELGVSYFSSLQEAELKKLTTAFFPEGFILFTHPSTKAVYSAKLIRKDSTRLIGKADYSIPVLKINEYVKNLTLSINDECSSFSGYVVSFENNIFTLETQE